MGPKGPVVPLELNNGSLPHEAYRPDRFLILLRPTNHKNILKRHII